MFLLCFAQRTLTECHLVSLSTRIEVLGSEGLQGDVPQGCDRVAVKRSEFYGEKMMGMALYSSDN
jgi:hypothetical protein